MKTIVRYRAITPEDFMNLFQEVTEIIHKWPNPSGVLIKDECDPDIIHLVEAYTYADITQAESERIVGQISFSKMNGEMSIKRAGAAQRCWDAEQERIRKAKPVSIEMTAYEWAEVRKVLGEIPRPKTTIVSLYNKIPAL